MLQLIVLANIFIISSAILHTINTIIIRSVIFMKKKANLQALGSSPPDSLVTGGWGLFSQTSNF